MATVGLTPSQHDFKWLLSILLGTKPCRQYDCCQTSHDDRKYYCGQTCDYLLFVASYIPNFSHSWSLWSSPPWQWQWYEPTIIIIIITIVITTMLIVMAVAVIWTGQSSSKAAGAINNRGQPCWLLQSSSSSSSSSSVWQFDFISKKPI